MTKYVWFKGIAQTVVRKSESEDGKKFTDVYFNAPMGFIELADGDNRLAWEEAIKQEVGNTYSSIRGLETVYCFAESLVYWKDAKGKAGSALSPACYDIRAYLIGCEARKQEVDRNKLRPLLSAWIDECYSEATVRLDNSAVTVTGRRVDDFLSRIGKDKADNKVRKVGKMVTGNRSTVLKSGSAFMRELCKWTMDVTQMKYHTVTRLEVG